MIGFEALRALRRALGERAVLEHEPVAVDGERLSVTLRPDDGERLAVALAVANELGLALVVRGGGSRLDFGNPVRRADALLSTQGLAGVDELDADEGVVHVRAGTPLSVLRDAANERGWELALDPPGPDATLGGTLAAAVIGPRCHAYGPARDCVLGLEVALGSGQRTRCGGRVVKNVTGFDMAKLYTGSLGGFGVIEAAWLRLRPRPQRALMLTAHAAGPDAAIAAARDAAERPGARAVALVTPEVAHAVEPDRASPPEFLVLVELAGDAPTVERDAESLARAHGVEECDASALARIRELQGALPELRGGGMSGLRFRIDALRSKLAAVLARLQGAGAAALVYPGVGLAFAWFALSGGDERSTAERALACVRDAARVGSGGWVLEAAPARVKEGRDVFEGAPELLSILRELKQRFDPAGVLNPGRLPGGI